jgi:hypothetical protein
MDVTPRWRSPIRGRRLTAVLGAVLLVTMPLVICRRPRGVSSRSVSGFVSCGTASACRSIHSCCAIRRSAYVLFAPHYAAAA